MQLFYTPDINGEIYTLPEEESRHCVRVLRKSKGDEIYLVDGRGNFYTGIIRDDRPDKCNVQIVDVLHEFGKRPYRLHIAIAPTKNAERYEWFLEKAVEIGVDAVTPLMCEHSERRTVKTERSLKVAASAMKQSVKAYHPDIREMERFEKFVSQDFGTAKKLIAHCIGTQPRILLKDAVNPGEACVILIGPEGDFSPAEIEKASEYGFSAVSLGGSRLRTETAGIVACATLQIINE